MNLARVRWAVRGALAVGVAASVTANVLHAVDNLISQAIAAWPPLALLITVELIARVPVHRMWLAAVRLLSVAVLAGIAAWVSYWHMVGVAVRYGETGLSAYLLPVSVDGLVVVASICLVDLSGRAVRMSETLDNPLVSVPDTTPEIVGAEPDNHPANDPVNMPTGQVDTVSVQVDTTGGQLDSEVDWAVDSVPLADQPNTLRVAWAHSQNPTAKDTDLARMLAVSTKTVQRYRPKSTTGQANGHAPQLSSTP